ncbi:ATP-binding protein [Vulcanisaeta distributa]|uniref:Poxvirus A32 n=1 Tax=Vulcanisaeta distributa (strain DSM 14429 / JCM 11212 / NBRC 100878 / IC-017) TaxID=572478 RepID=E1QQX5_VULDI|nr:Poxvirus A32 [Vulcanisaeta distributa DSM 14429]
MVDVVGAKPIDCRSVLGYITRQMPSSVTAESAVTYMISECQVEFPVGKYLVIEGDGVNYLARISESRIEDIYSVAKTPVLSLEQELSMDIRYVPRLIALELVAECRGETCGAPVTPPPIHAVVREPNPQEVSKMLSLPVEGIVLGSLALPSGVVIPGNEVLITRDALKHHMLVVGTTGSGKTTLLKNLALELITKYKGTTVIAVDAVGHYHHLALNNVRTKVLIPVTHDYVRRAIKRAGNGRDAVKGLAKALARDYINGVFRSMGIKVGRVRVKAVMARSGNKYRLVSVVLGVGGGVELIPWSLRTRDLLMSINELTGLLTEQARMFYGKVIREVRKRISGSGLTFERIYEYLTSPSENRLGGRQLLNYEVIAGNLGIHESTMENIVRALLAIIETRLFDIEVRAGVDYVVNEEPDYGSAFKPGYVVLDLRTSSALRQRIMVYRVLDRLFRFMGGEHLRNRDRMAVVLVDEAHLFFPQTRADEERRLLERHITRITRLGRSRGIAVVFATHMPDDLNDAIIQLTNTKVILRSDEKVLERLGVPTRERRFLSIAPTGLAYVKGFAYRYPIYIAFKPQAYHVG